MHTFLTKGMQKGMHDLYHFFPIIHHFLILIFAGLDLDFNIDSIL